MHPIAPEHRALALGATLYTPVVNPQATRLLMGEDHHGAGSAVVCLEDALAEDQVAKGLDALASALRLRQQGRDQGQRTLVFARPRNLEMARLIATMPGVETLAGFVAPKFDLDNGEGWLALAQAHGIALMPTIETAAFYDPFQVANVKRMCDQAAKDAIVAIRVGGNDLMSAIATRRVAGTVSHHGPLGYVLNMIATQFMAGGYHVSAPVYDIITDTETLRREVAMDVERGFVGKTAIHPCQVPLIQDALRPMVSEVKMARSILDKSSAAVFQIGGVMCEPATHSRWAERILARAFIWGAAHDAETTAATPSTVPAEHAFEAAQKVG